MNILIASEKYKELRYPKNHPLRVPRVSLMINYLKTLGFDPNYIEGRNATIEELLLFHTKDYIDALIEADTNMKSSNYIREKYSIGTIENPISAGMWKGSLLATGSSVQAVEYYIKNYKTTKEFVSFNPAGGMHHAMKSRANGFCFLNDPVIAIKYLLNNGFKKIIYIDLDAHHPDGVQQAFYHSKDVFLLSLHQSPDYAFPFKVGYQDELGIGEGFGYNMNVPLPQDINDSEFIYALEKAMEIAIGKFTPEVFVVQMGVDALKEDYLSKFNLSNNIYIKAIDVIKSYTKKFILLGGGGYNPISLARAWALIWLYLEGVKPEGIKIKKEAKRLLTSIEYEDFDELMEDDIYDTILDKPRDGDIRIKEYLEKIFSLHKFII
ncbi:acetoin utilization protein AcuC [Hydrogenobaculum acidophilum]